MLHRVARLGPWFVLAGLLALVPLGIGAAASQTHPDVSEHAHHDDTDDETDDHGGSADQAPTPEEAAATDDLVRQTQAAITRFADPAVAVTAGYAPLNPRFADRLGRAHYLNRAYLEDGAVLDPERPEGLVYLVDATGVWRLVGALYLAPIGAGPDIGGPLTDWHTHDNLCFGGWGVVPKLPDGGCLPGTEPLASEMMHVWIFDHPRGPLAHDLGRDGYLAAIAQLAAHSPPSDEPEKPNRARN